MYLCIVGLLGVTDDEFTHVCGPHEKVNNNIVPFHSNLRNIVVRWVLAQG